MAEHQIRVLSFNCWGLKYVSKKRKERIDGIAHELANSNVDIIALQEVWVFADYENIQERVSKQLPHSKFFYSGALGAGLAIFSRFPIISTSIHPYSLNGAPLDVIAGDWFVGKAAASVVILHPTLGHVQVFNTHLFAKGGEDGLEHHRAHRLVNAWELAKLARQAAELGHYVIVAGDLNSIPATLPISVIHEHAALSDSWLVTHPTGGTSISATTPLDAILNYGVTADSPLNTYSAGKHLDAYASRFLGKRLDYILYRQPHRRNEKPSVIRASECKVVMTSKVPGCDFSFSDHFGVEATLVIEAADEDESTSVWRSSTPPGPLSALPHSELSSASTATVIQALTTCYRFSRQRARKELSLFGFCLFLLSILTVCIAWFPRTSLYPVLNLLTIFFAWYATTMLYEGFLYGNWECNALMNVIEELEIYQKGLEIQFQGSRRNSGGY